MDGDESVLLMVREGGQQGKGGDGILWKGVKVDPKRRSFLQDRVSG